VNRAIDKDKDNVDPQIYNGLGCCYSELGQLQECKLNFTEAIAKNENNSEFWSNRAQAYYKSGNYDLAYADFSIALKLDPEDTMAYYNVGMCLFETKKYKEAIDMLKMSLRREEKCFCEMRANVYYHIGIAYCRRDKYEKAIYPLSQVIACYIIVY